MAKILTVSFRVFMKFVQNLTVALLLFVATSGSLSAAPLPEEALARLKEGNARYVSGNATHPDQSIAYRKDLANGQTPFAAILSCSDSRVPPEIIFDQGLGDLFSIRVAGNVADTDEIGTIEYGVGHLNTPLLVVLGHTKCGAVTAVVTGAEVHGSVQKLVEHIVPAVTKAKSVGATGDQLVEAAIVNNVWNSIADLLKRSPEAKDLVAKGKLQVVGAVYNLETGEVKWIGEHPEQKELLKTTTAESQH